MLPGVHAVHAVDAAGVHPLLLAIGSERYWPFADQQRPQELLTQANAILGQGQLSLAKFLLIANHADDPRLDVHDVAAFCATCSNGPTGPATCTSRPRRRSTRSTIRAGRSTRGSKLVIAAVGPKRFELATEVPGELRLPDGLR